MIAGTAKAATCPAPEGASPSLATIDAEARLAYVRGRLVHARKHATVWMASWGTAYTAVVIGQLAALPTATPEELPDRYVGAAGAAIGILATVAVPPAPLLDERELARIEARWRGDRCGLLAEAERLLFHAARRQRFNQGPLMHAGNLAFNVGLGLLLGLGSGSAGAGISVSW